jgi:hypothetical protein
MKSFNMLRSSPMDGIGPENFYIDGKPACPREYAKLDQYAVRHDCMSTRAFGRRWHHRKTVYL